MNTEPTPEELHEANVVASVVCQSLAFLGGERERVIPAYDKRTGGMSERSEFIYGLRQPLSHEVRYVGRTDNFSRRIAQHKTCAVVSGDRRSEWIGGLRERGQMFTASILAIVPADMASAHEKFWIAVCDGPHLLNKQCAGGCESLSAKRDEVLQRITQLESELCELREIGRCLEDVRVPICSAFSLSFDASVEPKAYEAGRGMSRAVLRIREAFGGEIPNETVAKVFRDVSDHMEEKLIKRGIVPKR